MSITKHRVKLTIYYNKSASSTELLCRARRGDATTGGVGSTDDVRRHLNAARTATHTRLALPLAAESVRSWNVIQRESLTGSSAPRTVGVSSVNGARSRRPTGERERERETSLKVSFGTEVGEKVTPLTGQRSRADLCRMLECQRELRS